MRDVRELNRFRLHDRLWLPQYEPMDPSLAGGFIIQSPTDAKPLVIVASNGLGWDHVSVSHRKRIPNWLEMQHAHRLFFLPTETAFQLHVPESDHINVQERTLHLWRPHEAEIPMPPKEFV